MHLQAKLVCLKRWDKASVSIKSLILETRSPLDQALSPPSAASRTGGAATPAPFRDTPTTWKRNIKAQLHTSEGTNPVFSLEALSGHCFWKREDSHRRWRTQPAELNDKQHYLLSLWRAVAMSGPSEVGLPYSFCVGKSSGDCSLTQAAEHLHVCCLALDLPQTDSLRLLLWMVEWLGLAAWQGRVRPSCNPLVLQIIPSAWKTWWTFETHQGLRERSSAKVVLDTDIADISGLISQML